MSGVYHLRRVETSDQGTFGRLLDWYTLELPWRNNAFSVSCIPVGIYRAVWTYSPRFRRMMYVLLNTAPRSGIRIHSANLAGDVSLGYRSHLNGCIAFGEKFGWLDGQKAVLVSAPAIRSFESMLGGRPFTLAISE